jgi:hypothetical protein
MALAILDGTQTATTLSTILSSGQHITAHTVVSLGTQAKTDILSAVSSGIAISGTVTANAGVGFDSAVYNGILNFQDNEGFQIASLPTISGTVTANIPLVNIQPNNLTTGLGVILLTDEGKSVFDNSSSIKAILTTALPAGTNRIGVVTIGAGTVTIGAGTAQIGSVTASISGTVPISISSVTIGNFPATQPVSLASLPALVAGTAQIGSVTVGNSVTIGSLPAISGTVTANIAISSSAITSGVFSSLTSATLVPGNTARKMATVYNLGPGQLFINAGASCTTLGGGFMAALSSSDYFECPFTTTTLSAIYATAGTASWVSH